MLRSTALVAPKIEFEPTKKELKQLYIDSGCTHLINVTGKILSDGAGIISFNDPNSGYTTSNSAVVSIKIYDLESGMLISSARATGKDTEENSEFEKDGALQFQTQAGPIMLQAVERLIGKYRKFRLDK